MEKEKEENWERAQSIGLSTDVVTSAKNLRRLLAAVDQQHSQLYVPHSSAVSAAIRRPVK
jgi:hypothetical protein